MTNLSIKLMAYGVLTCLIMACNSIDHLENSPKSEQVASKAIEKQMVVPDVAKPDQGHASMGTSANNNAPNQPGEALTKKKSDWILHLNKSIQNFSGFFENKGQLESVYNVSFPSIGDISYYTKVSSGYMYFGDQGIGLAFMKRKCHDLSQFENVSKADKYASITYDITFPNMRSDVKILSDKEQKGYINYIKGDNNVDNIPKVKKYDQVTYKGIWDDIDLVYYRDGDDLKYDFVLESGGAIQNIGMKYNGVDQLRINKKGQLEIDVEWGTLIDDKPYSYQLSNDSKKEVEIRYFKKNDFEIGFKIIGEYDHSKPLVIDPPTVSWSTYVSTAGADNGYVNDVAVDASGNVYIVGFANTTMPSTQTIGTFARTNEDVCVYKMSADGTTLTWGTIITAGGGGDQDVGMAIEVNSSGNAYIVGHTGSTDYPVVSSFQATNTGGRDIILSKLSADGSSLLFSSYYGGTLDDAALDMVLVSDTMFITGSTQNNGLATAGVYDNAYSAGHDMFVMKVNPAGTLNFFTYLGGTGDDQAKGIAYMNGDIWISGTTNTSGLATVGAYDVTYGGGAYDMLISRFSADGTTLRWSTYLGACCNEYAGHIGVNTNEEAIVVGYADHDSYGSKLPYQANLNASGDAILTGIGADGDTLIFSTWIGGSAVDNAVKGRSFALTQYWRLGAIDITDSHVLVTFETNSTDIGTTDPLTMTSVNTNDLGAYTGSSVGGSSDYYVALFDYSPVYSGGNVTQHSASYLGGTTGGQDYPTGGIALDPTSDCFILAGNVHSNSFPTTTGVYQPQSTNTLDQMTLTKICDIVLPVEYISFTASLVDGKALLQWITATEENNDYFRVLRSDDGRTFYEVGIVNGNGNSSSPLSYSFTDPNTVVSIAYYRLEQVDVDGQSEFSYMVSVNTDVDEMEFVHDQTGLYLKYNWELKTEREVVVRFVNVKGQIVLEEKVKFDATNNNIHLPMIPQSTEMYIVTAQSNHSFISEKIVTSK